MRYWPKYHVTPCAPFSVGFTTKILFRMWGIGQSTFSPSVPHFQLFSPRRLAEEAIGAPPSCTSLAQHCNEMTTDFQARDLWLNINHIFEISIYNLSLLSCPILRRIFESLRRPFKCAPSVLKVDCLSIDFLSIDFLEVDFL